MVENPNLLSSFFAFVYFNSGFSPKLNSTSLQPLFSPRSTMFITSSGFKILANLELGSLTKVQ